MPELPEVETIRRGLAATLPGKRIEAVTLLWPPESDVDRDRIDALVVGSRVATVRRLGKVLLLDLDNEQHLLLHPKMTGQLVVVEDGTTVFAGGHPSRSMLGPMPNTTTRVVLSLSAHTMLYFNDQRKFGWIRLVDTDPLASEEFLSRLGPEPLSDTFTGRWLRQQLARHGGATVAPASSTTSTASAAAAPTWRRLEYFSAMACPA